MSEENCSDEDFKYRQSLERLSRLDVSGPHCDPRVHGFTNGDIVRYKYDTSPISIIHTGRPSDANGHSVSYVCVVHTGEPKIEIATFFPSNLDHVNDDKI
jgi:hypothetical protein